MENHTNSAAGRFVDFFDDPDGSIITKVASERPELMNSLVPTIDEIDFIPDEQFAHVEMEKGAKVRHFPTNTPAATALSAEAYRQSRDLFTKEAQEKIEDRFGVAEQWHGIKVDPLAEEVEKTAATNDYALVLDMPDGSVARYYALPTPESVKVASEYFEEWHRDLEPKHRRSFANAVVKRASELGVDSEAGTAIRKYASNTTGPQAYDQVEARAFRAGKDTKVGGAYMKLASAIQEGMGLDDAVKALDYIDDRSGLGVGRDSTEDLVGEKVAAQFSEEIDGDLVTDDMLGSIPEEKVKQYMGTEMAAEFGKRPVEIFSSLPMDEKRVLKELAHGRL